MATNKMAAAKIIFAEVFAAGYDLKGKTQRASFIERAMVEIPMTKHGAATYYQNLINQRLKGQSLYKYNKSPKKVTKAEVIQAEQQVQETLLMLPLLEKGRWMVIDASGQEVHNFTSRQMAQNFAKDNDLKWADRTKAA